MLTDDEKYRQELDEILSARTVDTKQLATFLVPKTEAIIWRIKRVTNTQYDTYQVTMDALQELVPLIKDGLIKVQDFLSQLDIRIEEVLAEHDLRRRTMESGVGIVSEVLDNDVIAVSSRSEGFSEFLVSFAPELSGEDVKVAMEALANYYRACGGVGLQVESHWTEVAVREHSLV